MTEDVTFILEQLREAQRDRDAEMALTDLCEFVAGGAS